MAFYTPRSEFNARSTRSQLSVWSILVVIAAGSIGLSLCEKTILTRGGSFARVSRLLPAMRSSDAFGGARDEADMPYAPRNGAKLTTASLPVSPTSPLSRTSAASRHSYFWRCLNAAIDDTCLPDAETSYNVLPFAEWLAYTAELANLTHNLRALKVRAYTHSRGFASAAHAGPWLENAFIAHFYDGGRTESFYPLVPVFVPWTDAARTGGRDFESAVELLERHIRRDVLHVTLMDYDGIPHGHRFTCKSLRNVIVFSAAGWSGSVPVPLIKGEVAWHGSTLAEDADPVNDYTRKFVLAFVGDDSEYGRRALVRDVLDRVHALPDSTWTMYYAGEPWTWLTHAALFVVTPRGAQRASFQTADMLQYGRIPLVVYSDDDQAPWVPYQHTLDFVAPGKVASRYGTGGSSDVAEFGGILQLNAPLGVPSRASSAAAAAAAVAAAEITGGPPPPTSGDPPSQLTWRRVLNRHGVWGPGGLGFVLASSELPSFLCVACDFVRPGSAARWRRVRILPLHSYGRGVGQVCPCTADVWESATRASMGVRGNWSLPRSSLLYEMERRIQSLSSSLFTLPGVLDRVTHFIAADEHRGDAVPPLRCAPRPHDSASASTSGSNSGGSDVANRAGSAVTVPDPQVRDVRNEQPLPVAAGSGADATGQASGADSEEALATLASPAEHKRLHRRRRRGRGG